jgi:hypothetical protein
MCGGGTDTATIHDLDLDYYKQHFKEIAANAGSYMSDRMNALENLDKETQDRIGKVIGIQMPELREQYQFARQQRQEYLTKTQPMIENFMRDAGNYDTGARRTEAMGQATADVAGAVDAQRRSATMNLESLGVDPSQTRYQALDQTYGVSRALGSVQEATRARQDVESRGLTLRGEAINLGQGFATNAGQAVAAGTALGGQVGNLAATGEQVNASALGTPLQWAGLQTGALSAAEAAKLSEWQANASAKNAQNQQAAGEAAGFGSAIGTIGGALAGGLATGGNPLGMLYGSQAGSKLGGSAGTALG